VKHSYLNTNIVQVENVAKKKLGGNMLGTEKLRPLLIGKPKNLQYFKQVKSYQ